MLFDPNGYNLEWAQDGVGGTARDSVIGYLTALERMQVPYTVVESYHPAAEGSELLDPPLPAGCPGPHPAPSPISSRAAARCWWRARPTPMTSSVSTAIPRPNDRWPRPWASAIWAAAR